MNSIPLIWYEFNNVFQYECSLKCSVHSSGLVMVTCVPSPASASATATTYWGSAPRCPPPPGRSTPGSSLTRCRGVAFLISTYSVQSQCHFVYIGTPACEDCDGKRVYKSVECEKQWVTELEKIHKFSQSRARVYLHYHDYILDGRWVVTADLDSDDTAAVVRNLGDGWDDEECPEKESYVWQLRSRRAPGAGNTVLVAMFDEASTFIVTHHTEAVIC